MKDKLNKKQADFSGYVTSFNKLCSDGRTILDGCFDEDDGLVVPLVFQHNHSDVENVIGKVLLECRKGKGVYGYGFMNDTYRGQAAKEQVKHGDLTSLSIYANNLTQDNSRNVSHGRIREVSLVLAGANPGAFIDNVALAHADGAVPEDEMIYYSGRHITNYLKHSDSTDGSKTIKEVYVTMSKEQQAAFIQAIAQGYQLGLNDAKKASKLAHSEDGEDYDDTDEDDVDEYDDEEDYDEDDYDDEDEEDEDEYDEDEEDEEEDEIDYDEEPDTDDPETCEAVVDIIDEYDDDDYACTAALVDVIENGVENITPEEAAAILEQYDSMSDKKKWAQMAIISEALNN